jgi:hypothetical protein
MFQVENLITAFRELADESRTLDLLHRYEVRYDRQFARALNQLMKLADPNNPLTQFCQTNPSASALPPEPPESGVDLPACAGAEGASRSAVEPPPATEDTARPADPSTEPSPAAIDLPIDKSYPTPAGFEYPIASENVNPSRPL